MKNTVLKLIALLCAASITVTLTSCGKKNDTQEENNGNKSNDTSQGYSPDALNDKTKPLNESSIAHIIPEEIKNGMNVTCVSIDRRQANDKEDIVYAIIDTENYDIHRTSYYLLTINFYDVGGWMIDEWEKYQDSTSYPLQPPSDDIAYKALYMYENYDITLESTETSNLKNGECIYSFNIKKKDLYADYSGTVSVICKYSSSGGGWSPSVFDDGVRSSWTIDNFVGKWNGKREQHVVGANWYNIDFEIIKISDNTIQIDGNLVIDIRIVYVDPVTFPFSRILSFNSEKEISLDIPEEDFTYEIKTGAGGSEIVSGLPLTFFGDHIEVGDTYLWNGREWRKEPIILEKYQ